MFDRTRTILAILLVLLIFGPIMCAFAVTWRGTYPIPACGSAGGREVYLGNGDYLLLEGHRVEYVWGSLFYEATPGQVEEYPLTEGNWVSLGPLGEDGLPKWTIYHCSYRHFVIWETNQMPATPIPTPTTTPVAVIP